MVLGLTFSCSSNQHPGQESGGEIKTEKEDLEESSHRIKEMNSNDEIKAADDKQKGTKMKRIQQLKITMRYPTIEWDKIWRGDDEGNIQEGAGETVDHHVLKLQQSATKVVGTRASEKDHEEISDNAGDMDIIDDKRAQDGKGERIKRMRT